MEKLFLLSTLLFLVLSGPVVGESMETKAEAMKGGMVMEIMGRERVGGAYYNKLSLKEATMGAEVAQDCLTKGTPCSYVINPYPCCDGLCVPVASIFFGFCD